jgi:hypothetical protein
MEFCSGSPNAGVFGCNTYGNSPDEIAKKNACTIACCKCTDPPISSVNNVPTLPPDAPLCLVCGTNYMCGQFPDLASRDKCLTDNCGTQCSGTFPDTAPMASIAPVRESYRRFLRN